MRIAYVFVALFLIVLSCAAPAGRVYAQDWDAQNREYFRQKDESDARANREYWENYNETARQQAEELQKQQREEIARERYGSGSSDGYANGGNSHDQDPLGDEFFEKLIELTDGALREELQKAEAARKQ